LINTGVLTKFLCEMVYQRMLISAKLWRLNMISRNCILIVSECYKKFKTSASFTYPVCTRNACCINSYLCNLLQCTYSGYVMFGNSWLWFLC